MKFNCHCHIFGLDCVPEEFRQRFFLDPRNVLHRLMHWLVRRLVPSGAGLRDWLEFLDLSIEQIARRLVAEMDAAGIDVATPLMMDMAYCSGFGGAAKSFEEQMAETAAAVQAINAECGRVRLLPFVAADPRRDGVVPLVVQALASGAFHGVKIYPVMGFLPTDERLTPLYDHCVAHAVPVTTHCQNGGIPGLRRYYHLADPAGWERVLEQDRFRTLTLNLGHNDCTHTRWQEDIERLIRRCPNVYTDVSYNVEMWYKPRRYFRNVKRLLEQPDTRERVLYGTDWYMGRCFWTETSYRRWFERYARRIFWCRVEFTDEELELLMTENPQRFLGRVAGVEGATEGGPA